MIQEETLIPYQASPLPKGPWLVFGPHPDDETFGMGGTLLLASGKSVRVTLVVLTDGSLGGGEAGLNGLVLTREAEAREVSKRIGLESILFWRQPDRRLKISTTLINRVAELIRKVKPATVFFPSPMELHPDHRAASALVWEGLKSCPDFKGNAYAYEISVQCPTNRLIDITAVADDKTALATLYQSQTTERDYVNAMLALNRTRSYTLSPEVHFAEAFFAYERTGETALSFHTLNHLRPYWSDSAVFREEEYINENLRTMSDSARNEEQKWFQRCQDIENSRIWRYTKPARTVATIIKIAKKCARETGGGLKHYFERFF